MLQYTSRSMETKHDSRARRESRERSHVSRITFTSTVSLTLTMRYSCLLHRCSAPGFKLARLTRVHVNLVPLFAFHFQKNLNAPCKYLNVEHQTKRTPEFLRSECFKERVNFIFILSLRKQQECSATLCSLRLMHASPSVSITYKPFLIPYYVHTAARNIIGAAIRTPIEYKTGLVMFQWCSFLWADFSGLLKLSEAFYRNWILFYCVMLLPGITRT